MADGAAPAVAWSWPRALAGAVYALPAGLVAVSDPAAGVPLAVGVLPAALLPMPGPRRRRIVILLVGTMAGVSMFVGGLLAHLPTLAAATLLVPVVTGAAALAARIPGGNLVLGLCAPLVAAGLSYGDFATALSTMVLLVAGATYAWLVSLLWPERAASAPPVPPRPGLRVMVGYGIRMGTAAAIAYALAAALHLDHPGWAPAACLLVARPQVDLLRNRGIGRVLAVLVGAGLAVTVLEIDPASGGYAVLVVVVIAATAATSGSRWYITPGFSTLLVLLLLLYDHDDQAEQKFGERVGETVLGVTLAYLFGWLLPSVLPRRAAPRAAPP